MGIAGWDPHWLVGLRAVRAAHGRRLAALGGRHLTGAAVVRFAEDGSWFADCPVVLDFAGERVEICHQKFDDLSITWNAVDTTAPVAGREWFEFTPVWSPDDALLAPYLGGAVRGVALLHHTANDAAHGMVAVQFVLDTGTFAIANGMDENTIETGKPDPGYIRHVLATAP
jgi:hypothetical protein